MYEGTSLREFALCLLTSSWPLARVNPTPERLGFTSLPRERGERLDLVPRTVANYSGPKELPRRPQEPPRSKVTRGSSGSPQAPLRTPFMWPTASDPAQMAPPKCQLLHYGEILGRPDASRTPFMQPTDSESSHMAPPKCHLLYYSEILGAPDAFPGAPPAACG